MTYEQTYLAVFIQLNCTTYFEMMQIQQLCWNSCDLYKATCVWSWDDIYRPRKKLRWTDTKGEVSWTTSMRSVLQTQCQMCGFFFIGVTNVGRQSLGSLSVSSDWILVWQWGVVCSAVSLTTMAEQALLWFRCSSCLILLHRYQSRGGDVMINGGSFLGNFCSGYLQFGW